MGIKIRVSIGKSFGSNLGMLDPNSVISHP